MVVIYWLYSILQEDFVPMLREKVHYVEHSYMKIAGIRRRVTFAASVLPGYDWAAYVAASDHDEQTEQEALQATLEYGNKLPKAVAVAIFPHIKEVYRT